MYTHSNRPVYPQFTFPYNVATLLLWVKVHLYDLITLFKGTITLIHLRIEPRLSTIKPNTLDTQTTQSTSIVFKSLNLNLNLSWVVCKFSRNIYCI